MAEHQADENLTPSKGGKGKNPDGTYNRLVLSKEDIERVKQMAHYGCSEQDICDILGHPKDRSTLNRWYGDIIKQAKAKADFDLRIALFDKAVVDGDTRLLQFLAKARLKMVEASNNEEDDDNKPLPWSDDI